MKLSLLFENVDSSNVDQFSDVSVVYQPSDVVSKPSVSIASAVAFFTDSLDIIDIDNLKLKKNIRGVIYRTIKNVLGSGRYYVFKIGDDGLMLSSVKKSGGYDVTVVRPDGGVVRNLYNSNDSVNPLGSSYKPKFLFTASLREFGRMYPGVFGLDEAYAFGFDKNRDFVGLVKRLNLLFMYSDGPFWVFVEHGDGFLWCMITTNPNPSEGVWAAKVEIGGKIKTHVYKKNDAKGIWGSSGEWYKINKLVDLRNLLR